MATWLLLKPTTGTYMNSLDKALAFQALHTRRHPLVLPNPWDAGSAKILTSMGFEALATTSAGLAFSLGRRDAEGAVSREENDILRIESMIGRASNDVMSTCSTVLPSSWALVLLRFFATALTGAALAEDFVAIAG